MLRAGPVTVDSEAHEVTVSGQRVHLPPREFEILEMLVRNHGHVVTRDQLLLLWGGEQDPGSKSLEVHIRRLRGRIEEDPHRPLHLLTVRGLGYKFRP